MAGSTTYAPSCPTSHRSPRYEIIPLGWDNWSDPANEETVHFGEYGSKGPGAPKASPARAGYAALNDEASAQEMRAMLAEFRADFGAEA